MDEPIGLVRHIINDEINLPLKYLNANIYQHVTDELNAQRKHTCTNMFGYIHNVLLKSIAAVVSPSCSAFAKVSVIYEAQCIIPEVGKTIALHIATISDIGVSLVNQKISGIIPASSIENWRVEKQTLGKYKIGDIVQCMVTHVRYMDGKIQCIVLPPLDPPVKQTKKLRKSTVEKATPVKKPTIEKATPVKTIKATLVKKSTIEKATPVKTIKVTPVKKPIIEKATVKSKKP